MSLRFEEQRVFKHSISGKGLMCLYRSFSTALRLCISDEDLDTMKQLTRATLQFQIGTTLDDIVYDDPMGNDPDIIILEDTYRVGVIVLTGDIETGYTVYPRHVRRSERYIILLHSIGHFDVGGLLIDGSILFELNDSNLPDWIKRDVKWGDEEACDVLWDDVDKHYELTGTDDEEALLAEKRELQERICQIDQVLCDAEFARKMDMEINRGAPPQRIVPSPPRRSVPRVRPQPVIPRTRVDPQSSICPPPRHSVRRPPVNPTGTVTVGFVPGHIVSSNGRRLHCGRQIY